LRPEHIETANPNALKISKYHKKDRSLAVDQKTGLMEASRLLSGTLFIAQNVTLDWSFLIQASNTYNVEFDTKVHYHKLDLASMVFAKFYDEPRIQKCSLREMSEFFTVENKDAHSALSDARAAFEITNKVLSS
jgi:DNA polymerase III alpha subunit (gram-positive type)